MKKDINRKEALLIGVMVIFSTLLPVVTGVSLKGDPDIVYVSSELTLSEETKNQLALNESLYVKPIYSLQVYLKATKQVAEEVNGTLTLKTNLALVKDLNGELVNKEFNLSQAQTSWHIVGLEKATPTSKPFAIAGVIKFPEDILCSLELSYSNPSDETIYTKILEFTVTLSGATIDIISVSSPTDKYKGTSVTLNVKVKNTGTSPTMDWVEIHIYIKSIKAGETTDPYRNINGPIVLHCQRSYATSIPAGQTKTFTFVFSYYGYNNGVLNRGEWKIKHVDVCTANANDDIDESDPDFSSHITDPNFLVLSRTKDMQPHPVFIYYLWNAEGSGTTWHNANPSGHPRDYFTNGYGNVSAGLWRFETSESNITVKFKMVICYDNPSWDILDDLSHEQLRDKGISYVGEQLQSLLNSWSYSLCISKYNCGFDVLLMAAARSSNPGGTCVSNTVLVCANGLSTRFVHWQNNIDGVVQHELAHLLNCSDWSIHPQIKCIMVYGNLGQQFGSSSLHQLFVGSEVPPIFISCK